MTETKCEAPEPLVTNLIEATQFLLNQYGNAIAKQDKDDVQEVIERLQIHDRDSSRHVEMMERRMNILTKRLAEAKGQTGRMDIPWVRQELSMLKWAKARM
jgi:hypothetical protein